MQQGPSYTGATLGGRYAVGELLGRGGFGAVYRAVQLDLGRTVAIKVLHGDGVLAGDGLARFAREARAAAALGHPNIVQVIDFQIQPGEPPFIVMEHLEGRTFGSLLREQRIDPARVCAIAHQILSALDAAHRAGIVHRDVKPENVFLVSAPGHADFVKLLDFGLAKLTASTSVLTEMGTMLGTPAFMAPEQIANVEVDHRADIYALGATMFYALSGRYAYEAPNLSALLYAIVHQPTPTLTDVDPRLAEIVARAMHKDPRGRFSSAAEMRAALEPWSTSARPIGASMPAPSGSSDTAGFAPTFPMTPTPTLAPSRKNGATIAIVVGSVFLLVLLAAGAGGFYWLRERAVPATPVASASAMPSSPSPSVAPPTIASAATTPPSASAKPPVAPPPVATGPRMGARSATVGYGDCTFDLPECKAAIAKVMPAVNACFASTELDAPNHEVADYSIMLDPTGTVTGVQKFKTGGNTPHPKLDACITSALQRAKYPRSPGRTREEVLFRARL